MFRRSIFRASIMPVFRACRLGARRLQSTSAPRTDGFTEALPRRDVVAPIICCGVYGLSWWMAEEGRIKGLVEQIEMNTDPQAWPTPKQLLNHFWPFVAGTMAMMLESVACKFAATEDMHWLCTTAMDDDLKATVALCLLVAPAEHSPAFVRAVCEHGTMRRVKEIITIYKTLPREQHDDVLTNACVLGAKVAADPELRAQGLSLADFVWMMPAEQALMYTPYGTEGIAQLWQDDTGLLLRGGAVLRLAELAHGPLFRPTKKDSSIVNQELAGRLLGRLMEQRTRLLAEAQTLEEALLRAQRSAGPATGKRTIWQATGVHRGETEAEVNRRARQAEIESVRAARVVLDEQSSRPSETHLEQYGYILNVISSSLLGFVYGTCRGYIRGYMQDVTPSVCRELSTYVGRRTAVGCALLVGIFEAAPMIKREVIQRMGREEIKSYKQEGALEQLIGIDVAYLGVIAMVNFLFPFVLLPVAFNPTQLLVPPSDTLFPHANPATTPLKPS
mmetsp:Transcript_67487/g.112203  ORF Transcript_67487/g.112203 Transcript_67487/m.112203 type:complete len:504 (+) Transcript_67487:140-1651(+)